MRTTPPDRVHSLAPRAWLSAPAAQRVADLAAAAAQRTPADQAARLDALVDENHRLHDRQAFNLNPASNVLSPRVERLLASGLGTRASLGAPGDKYETGLEAIEEIEVIAAELVGQVFAASHVEVRVPSGALANTFAFLATCRPGDTIIAPPATIGGHVTHHRDGAAGWLGLTTIGAPVDAAKCTVDVEATRALAHARAPRLITCGASLNLAHHPVRELRQICDEVGADLLFDAAHLSGLIAGGAWPNPLDEGADLMTMSTYKSLGGPPGGLVVTRRADLAERLEAIAYPGFTANADPGRVAALAMAMVDWVEFGSAYATAMVDTARALGDALVDAGVSMFTVDGEPTRSHHLAALAAPLGGGQAAARRLGDAGLLCCGIGLPVEPFPGDTNGLRLGTPEIVRLGLAAADMPRLAGLVARGLADPAAAPAIRAEIAEWRTTLGPLRFVRA